MERKSRIEATPTKILSVRLPIEEAEQVDAMAKAAGLRRNDFIRLCLKENAMLVEPRKMGVLIERLRSLERLLEEHSERLEDLMTDARRNGWSEEALRAVERHMRQGERLMEELYKAQRKAVQVLDGIRAKVNRG